MWKIADENKKIISILSFGVFSAISGFALTVNFKRRFQKIDDQSLLQGFRLGSKALGVATLITITGFTTTLYVVHKIFDINSFNDLKTKAQTILPRVTKKESNTNTPPPPPQTTSQILTELFK